MKRLVVPLMFALSLALPLGTRAASTPARHVLLVAVTGYNHGGPNDASELNTKPDVTALKSVLITHLGFSPYDITTLDTPATTTHQAIVAAFRKYLIAATHPGDLVYFHYSGHGSRKNDPNTVTGIDQTLVPSDYRSDSADNDITNKEIAGLLKELKLRQPGNVLLTFDSCHSGEITRSGRMLVREYIRGMDPIKPIGITATNPTKASGGFLGLTDSADLGYTVISACRSDQVDSETIEDGQLLPYAMGSLSYALNRAFSEINEKTTYRDLMYRVQSVMTEKGVNDQDPQIEGNQDKVVFQDASIHPEPSILVNLNDQRKPMLQAGLLMGIASGTKVDIYDRTTKNFNSAHPIASGVVTVAKPTESELAVTFESDHSALELPGTHAIITHRAYLDNPLKVDISGLTSQTHKTAIVTALAPLVQDQIIDLLPTNQASANYDLKITSLTSLKKNRHAPKTLLNNGAPLRGATDDANAVVIQRADGSFLTAEQPQDTYIQALDTSSQTPDAIAVAVRRESRKRILIALSAQNPNARYKVEIQVIPCEVGPTTDPNTGETRSAWTRDLPPVPGEQQVQLPVGGHFRVSLRNVGATTAYVTILDIKSDGMIRPFWPDPRMDAVSNVVEAPTNPAKAVWIPIKHLDDSYVTWHSDEPTGQETLILIVTEKKADFSPLVDPDTNAGSRGATTPEARLPIGQMLRDFSVGSRSQDENMAVGDWSAQAYTLSVLPAATPP